MDHEGVFLAFFGYVSCRISRASGDGLRPLDPHQGSALDLLGPQNTHRSTAAGRSLHVVPYVIYKQQTQGEAYQF